MHVHNYFYWVRYAFWTVSCESVTSKFKNGAPLRIIPFYMPALFLQQKVEGLLGHVTTQIIIHNAMMPITQQSL